MKLQASYNPTEGSGHYDLFIESLVMCVLSDEHAACSHDGQPVLIVDGQALTAAQVSQTLTVLPIMTPAYSEYILAEVATADSASVPGYSWEPREFRGERYTPESLDLIERARQAGFRIE